MCFYASRLLLRLRIPPNSDLKIRTPSANPRGKRYHLRLWITSAPSARTCFALLSVSELAIMLRSLLARRQRILSSNITLSPVSTSYTTITVGPEHYDIPAGHSKSDMRATSCNIGLNRRRDLCLREDLKLHTAEGKRKLADIFRGQTAVVFGVPDMGQVCSETHVPSFKKGAAELRKLGVKGIYCIAVAEPEKAQAWAQKKNFGEHKIEILADPNASWSRLLGVDLEPPEVDGPHTQRYAALLEDGVLLKLRVEESPKDVKDASADSIIDCIKGLQALD